MSRHPHLAVFDPTQLLALTADDAAYAEIISDLLRSIAAAGTAPVEEAWQAWRDGRAGDAARRLHTARGSLGSFGLKRFCAFSLELEAALDGGASDGLDPLFLETRQALQAAIETIAVWVESPLTTGRDA